MSVGGLLSILAMCVLLLLILLMRGFNQVEGGVMDYSSLDAKSKQSKGRGHGKIQTKRRKSLPCKEECQAWL